MKSVGSDYELCTRNLSCYCKPCQKGNEECDNIQYVNKWEKRNLTVAGDNKLNKRAKKNANLVSTEPGQEPNIKS